MTQQKDFRSVAKALITKELSPSEQAELDGAQSSEDDDAEDPTDKNIEPVFDLPPEDNSTPSWVVIPQDLALPPGKLVGFMRFRAPLTDAPAQGERHCIVWGLTSADEKLALKRTRGEAMRTISEMAKQMIRSIDGVRTDWTGKGGTGNVDVFWDEIGARFRQQLINYYIKTHSLTTPEQADFFENCIAIRTAS